jgi:hypothetical protein
LRNQLAAELNNAYPAKPPIISGAQTKSPIEFLTAIDFATTLILSLIFLIAWVIVPIRMPDRGDLALNALSDHRNRPCHPITA